METKGKILYFDQSNFELTIARYQTLIDEVNKVAEIYESLGLGSFSQEVFKDILQNRLANIKTAYEGLVETEIKKVKFRSKSAITSLRATVNADLSELEVAVDNMFDMQTNLRYIGMIYLPVHLHRIIIHIDRPMLNADDELELKDELSITIKTDLQAEAYEQMVVIQQAVKKFVDILDAANVDYSRIPVFGYNGFLTHNSDQTVTIDPHGIEALTKNIFFIEDIQ